MFENRSACKAIGVWSFRHAKLEGKLGKASGLVQIFLFVSVFRSFFRQLIQYSTNQTIKELFDYLLTARLSK